MSNPDDYDVGGLLGSYGYMNITSFAAEQSRGLSATGIFENSGAGLSQKDIEKLKGQEVDEGNLQISFTAGFILEEFLEVLGWEHGLYLRLTQDD